MSASSGVPYDDGLLAARAAARIGEMLRGKYRLNRVIGVGGMASVFAATHRNGKEVALKLLHAELANHIDIRSRFIREGYLANQVKHPGAVSVIDDDETDNGEVFLVMELLTGSTVQALWDRYVQVHPGWVTAITLQVLDVMASAHEHGVIHRDLKPDNLFITRDGSVKVLDFGIARMRSLGLRTTNFGALLGTPSFMAPEQARGRSKEIDETTDLWAIGSVAFALLVGDVVHPAESVHESVILAATRAARALGPLAPGVPEPIVKVIDRALAFERSARWRSASEMRAALAAAAREVYGAAPDSSLLREVVGPPRNTPSCNARDATRFVTGLTPVDVRSVAPTLPFPTFSPTLGGVHTTVPSVRPTVFTTPARPPAATGVRNRLSAAGLALAATLALTVHWVGAGERGRATASVTAGAVAPFAAPAVAIPDPSPPPVSVTHLLQAGTLAPDTDSVAASTSDVRPSPAATPKTVHRSVSKAARASSSETASAAAHCDVPYTLDNEGHKHFRAECF